MVTMSFDKFEQIETNIDNMLFKPGRNFDLWYPTIEDISSRIRIYSEADVRFLMWLLSKDTPLTEKEKETQKYIKQQLYNPRHLVLTDNEEE